MLVQNWRSWPPASQTPWKGTMSAVTIPPDAGAGPAEAGTLWSVLAAAIERYADRPCLALRDAGAGVRWSYRDLGREVERVAEALAERGVKRGDRVLFWGANRPQWVAGFFALFRLGAVAVPLDYRSAPDFIGRVAQQTRAIGLIADRDLSTGLDLEVGQRILLEELFPDGAAGPTGGLPPLDGGPADLVEIVFTSGTTGEPKGVMITNRNLVANLDAVAERFEVKPSYRLISLLPLSHLFEQVGTMAILARGASVVYLHTLRPDRIFEAIAEEKATTILAVPQVLDLFLQGIEREVRRAGKQKQWELLHRIASRLPFGLRKLLFRPIHQKLGGHFDFFFAGGAMLDPEIGQHWENMGIKVVQGYGTTEAGPGVSLTPLHDRSLTTVGQPLKGIQVKLGENGELLIRGPQVTPGYWENPEATRAAFEEDWYKTGDLAEIDERGRIKLRGRARNLIVLANGLNVYPEDVEWALRQDPGVKDAVVVGLKRGRADIDIHAVLLLHQPDKAAADAAVRSANRRLAPHQYIRGCTIWPDEDFPRTLTQKPRRPIIERRLAELNVGETT